MATILGIDPGQNGGLAVIDDYGNVSVSKMPPTMTEIFFALKEIKQAHPDTTVFLEDVGQGMPGQSSKATATFARHNGHLEMALFALEMPTEKIKPSKWEKSLSNTIGTSKGHSKTEWKNILKDEAQRRFPKVKVTLWAADALLIAAYGKSQTK